MAIARGPTEIPRNWAAVVPTLVWATAPIASRTSTINAPARRTFRVIVGIVVCSLDDGNLAGLGPYRGLNYVEVDPERDVQVLLRLQVPGDRAGLEVPVMVERPDVIPARRENLDRGARGKVREVDLP